MKPGDFLLGVLDFFAILLPGSLATWLIVQYVPAPQLRVALSLGLGDTSTNPDPLVLGAAFLLWAYMLGHFVFMAGAELDPLYDRWRTREKPTSSDLTFQAAKALQQRVSGKIVGGHFSTLKWAKTYVLIKAPRARVEIDRLEADSKFFRSLVIVACAFAAHFALRERAPVIVACALATAVLAYMRFRDQRWKMTELSYATAVIADAVSGAAEPETKDED